MAFPSASGNNNLTLQRALDNAMTAAAQVKNLATGYAQQAASQGLNAQQIWGLTGQLSGFNQSLTIYAAVPNLGSFAQTALGSATLDIVAAFNTMQSAIVSTVQWVSTNFPVDAGGYLQYAKSDGNGNLLYTQFTPAQLTGFVTVLNSLAATIN
jgi:hypothetical protein